MDSAEMRLDLDNFPRAFDAIVCDLDGTLVETELLKARSYARVAKTLFDAKRNDDNSNGSDQNEFYKELINPHADCTAVARKVSQLFGRQGDDHARNSVAAKAMRVFVKNIGATSETVARSIVDELDLAPALQDAMKEYNVKEPWEALYKLRKKSYYDTFATTRQLSESSYPAMVAFAKLAHEAKVPLAVATSSSTEDAQRVLNALGLDGVFHSVVGRDQVKNSKPDPEIYLKACKDLNARPERTLVLEDSLTGVKAALAANSLVVAVASLFTTEALKSQTQLPQRYIAYDAEPIAEIVQRRAAELS